MTTNALSEPFLADARYAVRMLARAPLFTFTSLVSLALGIAATTITFALADALMFQASPGVRDAGQVVDIARTTNGSGFGTLSYPAFRYLRDGVETLESMAATTMDPVPLSMNDGAVSERVYGRTVSGNFFDVLGVRPVLGRFFRPDEDEIPDAHPVAVLSHRFWRERFGSDPAVPGRMLRLNDTAFTVIGVAEAGFENTTFVGTDLWVPMAMAGPVRGARTAELLADRQATWHMAVGRLARDATRETAQAELNTRFGAFKAENLSVPATHGIVAVPTGRVPAPVRQAFGAFVGLLFALTGGLLAIACSNVAGMLLARAAARRREMATRLALGASRGRLLRQLLVETLVLFLTAGLAAVIATPWLAAALQAFLPALPIPIHLDLAVTARGLMFAAAISLGAGVAFGLAPARHALGRDLAGALHGLSPTPGRGRLRLRQGLVIGQIAVTLALVITSGLFVRTLRAASQIDTGFRTADLDIVSIDTTLAGTSGASAVLLADRLAQRLRALAGVEAVGYARMIPLQGGRFSLGGIHLPGATAADSPPFAVEGWDVVSLEYFATVGLSIVGGRAFTRDDRGETPLVAIVNETFARAAWPGRPAVGQRFLQAWGTQERRVMEVVGVARDARYRTIGEPPRAFVYVPFAQHPQTTIELFVRRAAGLALAAQMRDAIRRVEPSLPVTMIQPFDDAITLGLLPQRVAAWIAGVVGTLGALLAAVGLYGLTAFLVAQRAREIAIRMALGATARDVRAMVLGQAARLSAIGGAAGLLLAWALGRIVQGLSLLVGIPPTDAVTFGGMVLAMSAVLFAASYVPARRATATDPAAALRGE